MTMMMMMVQTVTAAKTGSHGWVLGPEMEPADHPQPAVSRPHRTLGMEPALCRPRSGTVSLCCARLLALRPRLERRPTSLARRRPPGAPHQNSEALSPPARTPTLDRAALLPSRAVTPDQRSLGSSRCPTPEGRSPLASPRSLTPELRPPPSGSSRCGTPDHRLVPLLLSAGEDGAYAVSLLLAVMGMRRKSSLASVLHSIDGHAPSVYFYQPLSLSTGQDKLESRRQISEISIIFVLYRYNLDKNNDNLNSMQYSYPPFCSRVVKIFPWT